MPMHDWTKVEAGIFHAFHHRWISALSDALNGGKLPADYYALPEQVAAGFGPDVLTLHFPAAEERPLPGGGGGGVATATLLQRRLRTRVRSHAGLHRNDGGRSNAAGHAHVSGTRRLCHGAPGSYLRDRLCRTSQKVAVRAFAGHAVLNSQLQGITTNPIHWPFSVNHASRGSMDSHLGAAAKKSLPPATGRPLGIRQLTGNNLPAALWPVSDRATPPDRRSPRSRETFGRRFRRGRRPSPSAVDYFLRVA